MIDFDQMKKSAFHKATKLALWWVISNSDKTNSIAGVKLLRKYTNPFQLLFV